MKFGGFLRKKTIISFKNNNLICLTKTDRNPDKEKYLKNYQQLLIKFLTVYKKAKKLCFSTDPQ